ncbi:MAG: hypothetical protein ACFCUN_00270 [Hyphomicrobiaceae bacterium]
MMWRKAVQCLALYVASASLAVPALAQRLPHDPAATGADQMRLDRERLVRQQTEQRRERERALLRDLETDRRSMIERSERARCRTCEPKTPNVRPPAINRP